MDESTSKSPLADLSPTEFENLTYDTLSAIGLKNLVWRTPGADGGRDIEGFAYVADPTGHDSKQKWYVECKRYAASVDWPTVWKKLAYADSHAADVFLLSTNSSPSPACETEIARWNAERRRPAIRVWRGYEWKRLLSTFQDVALSYGLGESSEPHDAVRPITAILTKVVQSAYMRRAFDQDPISPLEASAAISELIGKRLAELDGYGRFVDVADVSSSVDYPWIEFVEESSIRGWDGVSLRAVLAYMRYTMGADTLRINGIEDRKVVVRMNNVRHGAEVPAGELNVIGRWGRVFVTLSSVDEFEVTQYGK